MTDGGPINPGTHGEAEETIPQLTEQLEEHQQDRRDPQGEGPSGNSGRALVQPMSSIVTSDR